MRDKLLVWIERISGRIHNWAWNKLWKERDPNEWLKGYRKWKKKEE